MNEYEINKRLAEIAGAVLVPHPDELLVYRFGEDYPEHLKEWSPLTDWSQLGPLMERFPVPVDYSYAGPDNLVFKAGDTSRDWMLDLKRAICLAIIAAHEE